MAMRIGVPAESMPGERRVAATPRTVESWRRSGFEVVVESGAGFGADIPDDDYREAGAQILESVDAVLGDQHDGVAEVRVVQAPAGDQQTAPKALHRFSLLRARLLVTASLRPRERGAVGDRGAL